MLPKFSLFLLLATLSIAGKAQSLAINKPTPPIIPDSPSRIAPALSISGSADVYYRYDFCHHDNDLTSFTHSHDQFRLGMAGVKLEYKTTRTDIVADLGVGPRMQEFAYTDSGITQAIKQLYISYSPNDWLKFTAGTWATHLCYESPDVYANRNYSMSYLFSNGPFSHTGVKADISRGNSNFMIGISNPTDYRSIPVGAYNNKNFIAQYSYTAGDKVKLCFNYVGGRDINDNRSHQYDFVLTAKFNTLFNIGFNSSVNRSSLANEKYSQSRCWWGSALYLNLDPANWLGLTLRTEYFDDKEGLKLPSPASIFATTLSVNLKIEGLTFIPEFRLDNASAPIFTQHDGNPTHISGNFLLAAVYAF